MRLLAFHHDENQYRFPSAPRAKRRSALRPRLDRGHQGQSFRHRTARRRTARQAEREERRAGRLAATGRRLHGPHDAEQQRHGGTRAPALRQGAQPVPPRHRRGAGRGRGQHPPGRGVRLSSLRCDGRRCGEGHRHSCRSRFDRVSARSRPARHPSQGDRGLGRRRPGPRRHRHRRPDRHLRRSRTSGGREKSECSDGAETSDCTRLRTDQRASHESPRLRRASKSTPTG